MTLWQMPEELGGEIYSSCTDEQMRRPVVHLNLWVPGVGAVGVPANRLIKAYEEPENGTVVQVAGKVFQRKGMRWFETGSQQPIAWQYLTSYAESSGDTMCVLEPGERFVGIAGDEPFEP